MAIDVNNNDSDEHGNSGESSPNDNITNDNLEDAVDTVIDCSDDENAGAVNYSITIEEEGVTVDEEGLSEVQIVRVRHVDNDIGTSNLAYSYDSIEVLPVLADLGEQCRHRYSVVIDNFDTSSDEEQDFSESLGTVPRTCHCNCHQPEQILPSYDNFIMNTIQHSDLILHDDINCNGVTCNSSPSYRTHSRNLLRDLGSAQNSPNFTPGNTPGRTRRLASHMVRILNSASNSPQLGKEPPNYRSLIFSIIKDEPPKYEEVTGKKLADELIPTSVAATSGMRGRRATIRQRIICIGTFIVVVTVTVLLLYLSAAVLDSEIFSGGRKSGKSINRSRGSPASSINSTTL